MKVKNKERLHMCPFCGNEVAVTVIYNQDEISSLSGCDDGYQYSHYYTVVCSVNDDNLVPSANWIAGCGGSGGHHSTEEGAIENWNKRIPYNIL